MFFRTAQVSPLAAFLFCTLYTKTSVFHSFLEFTIIVSCGIAYCMWVCHVWLQYRWTKLPNPCWLVSLWYAEPKPGGKRVASHPLHSPPPGQGSNEIKYLTEIYNNQEPNQLDCTMFFLNAIYLSHTRLNIESWSATPNFPNLSSPRSPEVGMQGHNFCAHCSTCDFIATLPEIFLDQHLICVNTHLS